MFLFCLSNFPTRTQLSAKGAVSFAIKRRSIMGKNNSPEALESKRLIFKRIHSRADLLIEGLQGSLKMINGRRPDTGAARPMREHST